MAVASVPIVGLERQSLESKVAHDLIGALNAELLENYPELGAAHFRLDARDVAPGNGVFFVASIAGQPVGCGAVRLLDAATAEIKRMFVLPLARGKGVGITILRRLEHEALALGATRIVLDTAPRQHAALGMYRKAGFVPIEAFGEYVGSALSVCLGKSLSIRT